MKLIAPIFFIVISITNYAQVVSNPTSEIWEPTDLQAKDFGDHINIPDDAGILKLKSSVAFEIPAGSESFILPVPERSGRSSSFRLTRSSVMHPELEAKFPEIKTFSGFDESNPSRILRAVKGPESFHAFILDAHGATFVEWIPTTDLYAVHRGENSKSNFTCEADDWLGADFLSEHDHGHRGGNEDIGDELKTYRFALALCGEITQAEGGFANGMLRAVELTSDLNLIYEREFSVHFELIANNDDLIFDDPATDPFSATDLSSFLTDITPALDSIIGPANFDIGHVINNTTGGVAYVSVACESYWKAGGTSPNNIGTFAHEIGHQMGCNHTFNACNGSSNDPGAWEPGSGNTIMSYYGNCGSTNMPGADILQYHTYSYSQIHYFITNDDGSTCPVITGTGNSAPVVTVPVSGKTIPIKTPFDLEGSVTDDGPSSSITYRWEQNDQGSVRNLPQFPEGSAPIFRSLVSQSEPIRTFPALNKVINGTSDIGETLPTYSRDLNFRMMALDNNPGAGGVSYDSVKVHVEETAGPFKVLYPNSGSEQWSPGQTRSVEWDVSNTDLAPVSCNNVDILISYDGGYTYPGTLASAVSNDGQHDVVVPNNPSSNVRIRVQASDNFFFDISDENFEIVSPSDYDFSMELTRGNESVCSFGYIDYELDLFPLGTFSGPVDLQLIGLPAGVTSDLPNTTNSSSIVIFGFDDLDGLSPGIYPVTLQATESGGTISHSEQLEIEILGHADPVPGNALDCDGSQKVYVDHHPHFQLGEQQSFSAECWFKTSTNSSDAVLMGPKDWLRGYFPGWVIAMQDGELTFNIGDGSLRMDVRSTPTTYNDGEWHHVAATFDRSGQADEAFLYVDGHLVDQDLNGHLGSINVSGAVDFGIGQDGRNHYKFDGLIEELRVWRKALSATEVRESMHLTLDDCEESLIAYFQFNETTGNLMDPVSQIEALVITGSTIPTTCPVGPGNSNSQQEALGPINFNGAGFLADYWTSGDANATTTQIEYAPFGSSGISPSEIPLNGQYWVKNRFEENGAFQADLTFSGITVGPSQEIIPSAFSLYGRPFNSDGDWSWIANASQASASNGSVTFANIAEDGQYLLTETEVITDLHSAQSINEVSVSVGLDGQILINLGGLDNASVNVYSANGQLVYQATTSGVSQFPFNLNEPPGLYILEVDVEDKRSQHKLVLSN